MGALVPLGRQPPVSGSWRAFLVALVPTRVGGGISFACWASPGCCPLLHTLHSPAPNHCICYSRVLQGKVLPSAPSRDDSRGSSVPRGTCASQLQAQLRPTFPLHSHLWRVFPYAALPAKLLSQDGYSLVLLAGHPSYAIPCGCLRVLQVQPQVLTAPSVGSRALFHGK